MSPRELRYAKNEAVFREVNNRIAELTEDWSPGQGLHIICECATAGCVDRIEVPLAEYERVRQCPDWFLIMPGHILPEAEHVIEQQDGYDIIKV